MTRRVNPMISLMQDWGGWRRTKKIGQGWGGAVDFERDFIPVRDSITHSDRTLSEVIATIADGQGVFQFIDRRIAEYYPARKLIMRARYECWAEWQPIAEHLKITVGEVEVMHRAMLREIRRAICAGEVSIQWDRYSEDYRRQLCAA